MPSLTDTPPNYVRTDLDALSAALDQDIPAKQMGRNLLIATWNIRSFGSVTNKWTATSSDSPKRDLRGLRAITEIVSRFDVVGIQEVVGNLRALRDMVAFLGSDWSYLMTDVTLGSAGHNERMAFVFDRRRVVPSGLAAELVVPPEWHDVIGDDALPKQFARTPYAVSFRAGGESFILSAFHIDYEATARGRITELGWVAEWMAEWSERANRFHGNLLVLGDFNIDRRGDNLWQAFVSTGLTVPGDLQWVPRSIFADPDDEMLEKYYDQIAWFQSGSRRRQLTIDYITGGGFDFMPHVYTDRRLTRNSISYRMSDHYPLWVEFGL